MRYAKQEAGFARVEAPKKCQSFSNQNELNLQAAQLLGPLEVESAVTAGFEKRNLSRGAIGGPSASAGLFSVGCSFRV